MKYSNELVRPLCQATAMSEAHGCEDVRVFGLEAKVGTA